MNTTDRCRVALLQRWPHECGDSYAKRYPHLEIDKLDEQAPPEQLVEAVSRAQIYQARSTRSELHQALWVDKPLLAACPDLLAVSTNGSGYDTVNLDACTEAGVLVVNQAGGNKQAVAEHALAMMLCLSKQIIQSDRALRRRAGVDREAYMGRDLHGKTLGIVGLGHIGSHVARLAGQLFGMRILAFDPFLDEDEILSRSASPGSFSDLLQESDFISVHCPRNSSSEHLFDESAFGQMKSSAFFVSTARGGIHDETALAAALTTGKIAGAGLDVWEDEPPAPDHPLLQLDNVIASPHTAGVTYEARANIVQIMIDQLDTIARGERPPRLLNPEVWEHYLERRTRLT